MQMRPEIQIQSMLKALNDVVLPAVDANNPLAQEQTRLCMGMLTLMAAQLPKQFRFDCDELSRLIKLAHRMQEIGTAQQLAPQAFSKLNAASSNAVDVLARAQAEPAEVLGAIKSLREYTSRFVQESFENDTAGNKTAEVQRLVLDSSKEQLLRDRSWVLIQGWEAEPQNIPPIDTLLAQPD